MTGSTLEDLGWPVLIEHWAKRCATTRGAAHVRAFQLFVFMHEARERAMEITEARGLASRDAAALKEAKAEFAAEGLTLHTYSADIAEPEACTRFVAKLVEDHGGIDILVNNAGRSIRRSIEHSYDRLHDLGYA